MEYLKSALSSIKMNKGRSFLTMLGIIIGIASVITILSIGNGMKNYVNQSLDDITSGAVTIQIDEKKTDRYLTQDQLDQIVEAVPEIYGASPTISTSGVSVGRYEVDTRITGGTPVVQRDFNKGVFSGRFFRDDEVESGASVCVIDQSTAFYLFGTDDVLDRTIEYRDDKKTAELRIIGVMKIDDKDLERTKLEISNRNESFLYGKVYVPYTFLITKIGMAGEKIKSFAIYTRQGKSDESALKVKSVTENLLDLRGEGAVKIQSFASFAATYNNILNMVTMVVTLIAAISLVVGGIGVMNIMTVTVTERTREIGIRKSLGARTQYILLQFLTESALITLIGGFIGMVFGWIATRIAAQFMSFPPVTSPMDVLIVVAISIADGLFFGIYPAKKAAVLNPIEALRQE